MSDRGVKRGELNPEQSRWLSTFQLAEVIQRQPVLEQLNTNECKLITSILPRAKRSEAEANQKREDPRSVSPRGSVIEQARKSTRWMPRRVRPMKDVETDETFKGSCIQAMSLENPNGATHPE